MGLLWPNSFINGCFPFIIYPSCWVVQEGSAVCLALLSLHRCQGGIMPYMLVRWDTNTHVPQQRVSVTYSFLSFLFIVESENHTNLLSPFSMYCPSFRYAAHFGFPRDFRTGLGEARSCLDPNHSCAYPHGDVSPLPDGFKLLL